MILEQVEICGRFAFSPIHEIEWLNVQMLAKERGVNLPDYKDLDKNLRKHGFYLTEPVKITLCYQGGHYKQYNFKPYYMTDLASVPAMLRGIVDNSSPEIIFGALPHDADYGGHFQTIKKSNRQLYDMCRFYGMSWLKAKKVWLSVAMFGWMVWHKTTADINQHNQLVSFFRWSA